jgi:SAM-dependent methyltransferase
MPDAPYDALAEVYDWLVPEALLTPTGSAAAFAPTIDALQPGSRVLDCACGTGTLAVGLALQGFAVVATDASGAMVRRTRALAAEHGAELRTRVCTWEQLGETGWQDTFDAVFCIGNSIAHAAGRDARRAALRAMAGVLALGGLLALTSRNWERPQPGGEEAVERGGRRAVVRREWRDGDPRTLAIEIAVEDGTTYAEALEYWPFTHDELLADLEAAGFAPAADTWTPGPEPYLVTSRAKSSNASR